MKGFEKIDQYGRKYIAAPKGKVLKGYLLCNLSFIEHCIVDQYGCVFCSGRGGWTGSLQHSDHYKLVVFPNPVERGNDGVGNNCWSWEDWYEKNWQCDSWAWIYCKQAKWRDNLRVI